MVLGNLMGGFITIVVGVNLMPVVADQVYLAQYTSNGTVWSQTNVTGAAATLLDLSTLFFALGIMSTAIGVGVAALRQSGLV